MRDMKWHKCMTKKQRVPVFPTGTLFKIITAVIYLVNLTVMLPWLLRSVTR